MVHQPIRFCRWVLTAVRQKEKADDAQTIQASVLDVVRSAEYHSIRASVCGICLYPRGAVLTINYHVSC